MERIFSDILCEAVSNENGSTREDTAVNLFYLSVKQTCCRLIKHNNNIIMLIED